MLLERVHPKGERRIMTTPLLLERKDPDRVKITSLIKEDVQTRIIREARVPAASMLLTMSAHSTGTTPPNTEDYHPTRLKTQ